ncbi:MAG TPA: YggT family protein [Bacillales bacterium]|nr:YggT family protein [Bacillales bacterium]
MAAKSFFAKWISIIVEIIEAIIGIHILLKLFGANSGVPFVNWMYHLSAPLLAPFKGIFENMVFNEEYVLDLSAVFALVVYGIVGYLIMMLLGGFGGKGKSRRR